MGKYNRERDQPKTVLAYIKKCRDDRVQVDSRKVKELRKASGA